MTPINGPRWTIAAATAVAVTIGGTGFALANSGGGDSSLPEPISLKDRVAVQATADSARSLIEIVPSPLLRADLDGSISSSISLSADSISSDSISGDSLSSDSDSISSDSISRDSLSSDSVSISSDSMDSSV